MKQGTQQVLINSPNIQQRSYLSLSQNLPDQNEKQSDIISQLSIFQPDLSIRNSIDILNIHSHQKSKEQLKIQNIQRILFAKSFTDKDAESGVELQVHDDDNLILQKLSHQKSDLPVIVEQNHSKPLVSSGSISKEGDSSNQMKINSPQSIKDHFAFSQQLQEAGSFKKRKAKKVQDNIGQENKLQNLVVEDNDDQLSQQIEFTSKTPYKNDYFMGMMNLQQTQCNSTSNPSQRQFSPRITNTNKDSTNDDPIIKGKDKIGEDNISESTPKILKIQDGLDDNLFTQQKSIQVQLQLSKIVSYGGGDSEHHTETAGNTQRNRINGETIPTNKVVPFNPDIKTLEENNIQMNNMMMNTQVLMNTNIEDIKQDGFSRKSSSNITNNRRLASYKPSALLDASQTINYEKLLHSTSKKNFDRDDALPWYILSPYSQFKSLWNILLLLLMFFNAIVVPVKLAFKNDIDVDFTILDICIDSLFILEFIQSFISAYEDEEGKTVASLSEIVSNYIKGWFWVDFVSSIMVILMNTVEDQNIMRLFRIPKIYKQIKHTKLFHILNSGPILKCILFLKINSHYMDILRFSVIILFLIHITGCLWYYVASLNPNQNWFLKFYETNDEHVRTKYISSVYYVLSVLTTVGYGNIASQNMGEYIFTILFMFFAVVIYSWIIGVLTYSFFKINENSTILKNRFIYFNQIVANYKLSRQLQEKLLKTVQMGFHSTSNRRLDIFQNNPILKDLPEEIVSRVCEDIFQSIIKKITFLSDKPIAFVSKLIKSVKSFHMNPGDILYNKGDTPKDVYFVVKGRIVTKIQSSFLNFKTLVYVEGSFFGEVDMIYKRERKQSAFAETKCEIWRLSKQDFYRLINFNEEIKGEILQLAIKKEEMLMKEEMRLLRAKLKENPSINSLIIDEKAIHSPVKSKGGLLKSQNLILQSQQSIGEMINDEIAIQSKKKAYNTTNTKEMSLTDIIKMSTKRLISSDEELRDRESTQGNSLNCTQQQVKNFAIEKMLENINSKEDLSLNRQQIQDIQQAKKIIPYIQRACCLDYKHHQNFKKDQELENLLKKSVNTIRQYLKQ